MTTPTRYVKPGWFTTRIFNPIVAGLTRLGLSVRGSRVLEVRGRRSGEVRTNPVNLLTVDGEHYLVSPRGQTQWVRNLRAAGEGTLRLGKRRDRFTAVEIAHRDKARILRPYLTRWKSEVGAFFEGVGPNSSDDELLAIGPNHPVFHITLHGGTTEP